MSADPEPTPAACSPAGGAFRGASCNTDRPKASGDRPSLARVLAHFFAIGASALFAWTTQPLGAQDYDDFATHDRLERRLRGRPDDTRVLCELGWLRHRLHLDLEADVTASGEAPQAAVLLDHSIALLGAPEAPALRRRLAACLYSRGRVAEVSSLAAAIPFYERSLALRPSDAVTARLDGARRAVEAAWSLVSGRVLEPEIAAALASLQEEDSEAELELLARWRSSAGAELLVLTDLRRLVVAARAPRASWTTLASTEHFEGAPGDAWLEAPAAGEAVRVVATWARATRVTGDDGASNWGAYIQGWTVAIGTTGIVEQIALDPWE